MTADQTPMPKKRLSAEAVSTLVKFLADGVEHGVQLPEVFWALADNLLNPPVAGSRPKFGCQDRSERNARRCMEFAGVGFAKSHATYIGRGGQDRKSVGHDESKNT